MTLGSALARFARRHRAALAVAAVLAIAAVLATLVAVHAKEGMTTLPKTALTRFRTTPSPASGGQPQTRVWLFSEYFGRPGSKDGTPFKRGTYDLRDLRNRVSSMVLDPRTKVTLYFSDDELGPRVYFATGPEPWWIPTLAVYSREGPGGRVDGGAKYTWNNAFVKIKVEPSNATGKFTYNEQSYRPTE